MVHKLLSSPLRAFLVLSFAGTCGGPAACSSDSDKSASDPIAQGKAEVVEHACATCHQPTESGIGTLAGQTTPQPGTKAYPANLTPDSDTGIGDWDEDTIVKAILTGVDDEGENLCPPMPHFGTEGITEEDAHNIAKYLKSLPAVKHEIPESECAEKGGSDTDAG